MTQNKEKFFEKAHASRLKGVAKDRRMRMTRVQLLVPAIKRYLSITRQEAAAVMGCSNSTAGEYLIILRKAGVIRPDKMQSMRVISYEPTNDEAAEETLFATLRKAIEEAERGSFEDPFESEEEDDEIYNKKNCQKVIRSTARQVGMARDSLVAAFFGSGPAHSLEAV